MKPIFNKKELSMYYLIVTILIKIQWISNSLPGNRTLTL